MAKKARKLEKSIEGGVVTIKELVTGTVISVDFNEMPDGVKSKLGPFGLSHKVGDAAAGVVGQEAVDSMKKVVDALMADKWTVPGVRGESISVSAINTGIDRLPAAEQMAARQLMLRLGIIKAATQEDVVYLASIGITAVLPAVAEDLEDAAE